MNKSTTLEQSNLLFKAFADPVRLRILNLLGGGELCVCQFMDVLCLPQSTVSRHLAYLKRAGLVRSREEGTWNHYSLAFPASPLQARLLECVCECLRDTPELHKDKQRLERCCVGS